VKNPVYFSDVKAKEKVSLLDRVDHLMDAASPEDLIEPSNLVAVKLHFGEPGNSTYIRPIFAARIVSYIQQHGGKPFLTDTNTLYAGRRSDSVSHLAAAVANGFAPASVGAPLIIADGLLGNACVRVPIKGKLFDEIAVAHDIYHADGLVSVAHFTGHGLTGFAATIKNLGMGGVSREAKLSQHSNLGPKIVRKKCRGCGTCIEKCAFDALSMVDGKARIDLGRCGGCGLCIVVCPHRAIQVRWNEKAPVFQKKLVEHALGVLHNKQGKALFLNFLVDMTPSCDCLGASEVPSVDDIGILSSTDPVAIDQAAVDLVKGKQGNPNSRLKSHLSPGEDKLRGLYPEIDWEVQLEYAEEIGLGHRAYELIPV
jgi:uncharacterized Fe-S center protein